MPQALKVKKKVKEEKKEGKKDVKKEVKKEVQKEVKKEVKKEGKTAVFIDIDDDDDAGYDDAVEPVELVSVASSPPPYPYCPGCETQPVGGWCDLCEKMVC